MNRSTFQQFSELECRSLTITAGLSLLLDLHLKELGSHAQALQRHDKPSSRLFSLLIFPEGLGMVSRNLLAAQEFIGDAILSVYGAPLRNPMHADAGKHREQLKWRLTIPDS